MIIHLWEMSSPTFLHSASRAGVINAQNDALEPTCRRLTAWLVRLDPPHGVELAREDKPSGADSVAQEESLHSHRACRFPLAGLHFAVSVPMREFIDRESGWAVGPWNEPNQRPHPTRAEFTSCFHDWGCVAESRR